MFSMESYNALRQGTAFVRRTDRGVLKLTGADRATWLQGLVTNDVLAIPTSQRGYGALLTPQGRMVTDLWVVALPDHLLLDVPSPLAAALQARLDGLIFAEDVQVANAGDEVEIVWFAGADHYLRTGDLRGSEPSGLPAIEAPLDTLDVIRIEAGVPKFLVDMDEHTIPLEAGIEDRAISFTKGCYVGQEVIVRVTTRGQGRVAKRLVGLVAKGGLSPFSPFSRGTPITAGDREIGRVTSAARSPMLGRDIALGYVHRDFVEPGTEVSVGGQPASVSALPFAAA